jgi:flagellar hook assembly protein FlgD
MPKMAMHQNTVWSTTQILLNPTTTIRYALPQASYVTLTVYNIVGQRVATLVAGTKPAGYHDVSFDASGLGSGAYVYRIQAGSFSQTRTLFLVK